MGRAFLGYLLFGGGGTALLWLVFNLDGSEMDWLKFLICISPMIYSLGIFPALMGNDDDKKDK